MRPSLLLKWVARSGQCEATQLHMPDVGISDTYASLLRRCKVLSEGKKLHFELAKHGHDHDRYLGNLLVQMYGNCGSLQEGRSVFDKIRWKNVFSWNIMISAYAQNGHLRDAGRLYQKMPEWDVVSCTTIVAAFAQNGYLQDAKQIFSTMPHRNVVSWNAMVTAYAQNGLPKEALEHFRIMALNGIQPDVFTFSAVLDVCASLGAIAEGKVIHEKIEDTGARSNAAVESALVNMYGKCGSVQDAKRVFDTMSQHNVVSSTAMLAAFAHNGHLQEARIMFDNLAQPDLVSWNVMIGAYAHSGCLQEARNLFDRMPEKNLVSWNAMITAYAQNGHASQALKLFIAMDLDGIQPNEVTFVSVLDACADGALRAEGKAIHDNVAHTSDVAAQTALVNFYAKCGHLEHARCMFEEMSQRDTVSWNAMIAAYAKNGHGKTAHELFQAMHLEGMQPNESTFIIVLNASSHAGMLDTGWNYFASISREHGMKPTVDHYMCMIDLLGRAGQLSRAEELINNMPFVPSSVAWTTFLGACKIHGDRQRGASAADGAVGLDPCEATNYVLLSNAYAEVTQ